LRPAIRRTLRPENTPHIVMLSDKVEYLTALMHELDTQGKGQLDAYLKPFVRSAVELEHLAVEMARTRGLDGNPNQPLGANEVLGKFSDPVLQARYQQQEQKRSASLAPVRDTERGATRQDRGGRSQ
jgi:hypothetical protein